MPSRLNLGRTAGKAMPGDARSFSGDVDIVAADPASPLIRLRLKFGSVVTGLAVFLRSGGVESAYPAAEIGHSSLTQTASTDGKGGGYLAFGPTDATADVFFSRVGPGRSSISGANGLKVSHALDAESLSVGTTRTEFTSDAAGNVAANSMTLATALAIAQGGTGGATAVAARAALGLVLGTIVSTDGWYTDSNTWTYLSGSSFTVPVDATGWLKKGTKVSWNDGSVQYGVVASATFAAGVTTVTLITTSDYTIVNTTITAARYSYAASPPGFPTWFNWTPTYTGWSVNPTNVYHRWRTVGTEILITIRHQTSGTSNNTVHLLSLPVSAAVNTNDAWFNTCVASDNGTVQTGSLQVISSAPTTVACNGILATSANTASGSSRINGGQLTYMF